MPLGCAPRFEPRSGGPAGVSTRCARPPRVPSMTDSLEVQVLYPA